MINFNELFFNEDGYLLYAEHQGKRFFANSPLWEVKCNDAVYTIRDMTEFSYIDHGHYMELFWNNDKTEVSVCIFLDKKYEFNISVKTADDAIEKVVFPIFNDVNSISNSDENAFLLLPYQNGWLVKSPVATILDYKGLFPFWLGRGGGFYENEYPAGYSFQFASYYDPDTFGCYFATEDGEAYIKTFGVYPDGNGGMRFSAVNYPENARITTEYVQQYNFVMTFFEGDWQDSAEIYRKWGENQKWANKKLSEKEINSVITNTDLWRINHTNYRLGMRTDEYLETSKILKEKAEGKLSLHWYGWNMGEHDVNYPEYISRERKKEGWEDKLTSWIEKIHENGISVIPYVNARLWDSSSISWEESNAVKSAVKDECGNLLNEPWKKGVLKPMCPSTVLWDKTASDFSQYITNHNFDGLYVDQVGSYNAVLCFDKSHPHPAGGGSWWKDTYTQLMRNMRMKSGKGKLFTTESCCEAYLDVFDLLLVLDTTVTASLFFKCMNNETAEPVPLFNIIYGDYGQLYGSCARFSDHISVFEFNYIRNILWGFMPTVEGGDMEEVTNPNAEKFLDVMHEGVRFFKENKDLLIFGRLKRVLTTSTEKHELDFGEEKLYYESVIATRWEDRCGKEFTLAYNLSDNEQYFMGSTIPPHSFIKEEL